MKKIIRLTESDLTRIVKRVISEQIGWQLASTPNTELDMVGVMQMHQTGYGGGVDNAKSLSNLFYWAKKNNGTSDIDYKSNILKLYNAMNGAGTTESVLKEVLGGLQNMNQLSKLVNNWTSITGSSDSLYDWLIGDEYAEYLWQYIGSWKDKYSVYQKGKYIQLTT
jgi:hypothetical protein